ncbi:MAG: PfkB family carbohydrate kinase [Crenarchaeota archaeon]|nr:PfkB family carbohydrate kinase [Thermoproteota archaeon]
MKILILGSLTIDIIEGRLTSGGPALYCSLAAELLGLDYFCCGIKPKEYRWEVPRGHFLQSDGPVFEHKYESNSRISKLLRVPGIYNSVLPNPANFDAVFINPVYREFEVKLMKSVVNNARAVIDAQGLVRIARDDRIEVTTISKDEFNIIESCWAIHISVDELPAFDVLPQKPLTVITFGENGAKVRLGQREYYIPAYRVDGNPTGAGDFFMVAFIAEYLRNKDLIEACLYAASLASLLVEGKIPRSLSSVRGMLKHLEPIIKSRMNKLRNGVRYRAL